MIAGAPEEHIRALFDYGDSLGIAFQVVDDLLDYGGVSASLGKNTGDDFRERKMTLPVIKAIAGADDEERAFWRRTIEKGDQRDGDLERALELMSRHGALEATRDVALARAEQAKTALAALPRSELRDSLIDLADFVVMRAV